MSIHFSEVIRDAILVWAVTKTEKDLAIDRAKAIITSLESNKFIIVHTDVIEALNKQMNAMEKQNGELAAIIEKKHPKKPLIIRPN